MAEGTSLLAFKQALVSNLAGRAGLSGVTVSYSPPETEIAGDHIWIEGARAEAAIPTMKSGTRHLDEDVTVTVVVQVLKTKGETQETADTRAQALLAEVQQEIAEDPRQSNTVKWSAVTGWRHEIGMLPPAGHGSRFEVDVFYKARLSPSA